MKFILHPLLFGLFPVLTFFAYNKQELLFTAVVPSLGYAFLLAVLLMILGKIVSGYWAKGAVIASLILIVFFGYGHAARALSRLHLGANIAGREIVIGPDKILFPLAIMFTLAAIGMVIRLKIEKLELLNRILLVTAVGMMIVPTYSTMTGIWQQSLRHEIEVRLQPGQTETSQTPDIYYLVFDRYANNRTIKDEYGYDNSGLWQNLESQGFYVVEYSLANYPKTIHSLASTLNMSYLDEFGVQYGTDVNDQTPLVTYLENNQVQAILRDRGYRFFNIGSIWPETRVNKNAEINYSYSPQGLALGEVNLHILESSMLTPILSLIGGEKQLNRLDYRDRLYETTRYQLSQLEKITGTTGPKFVFAHILLPHEPYIFHADGSYKDVKEEEAMTILDNYLEHLEFTNSQIARLLPIIRDNAGSEAVVILQSDEGPHPLVHGDGKEVLEWHSAAPEVMREKLRIQNAVYLPDGDYSGWTQDMTPVNTFRLLFDKYFGMELGLLPNRAYVFSDAWHIYNYTDVTEQVKY